MIRFIKRLSNKTLPCNIYCYMNDEHKYFYIKSLKLILCRRFSAKSGNAHKRPYRRQELRPEGLKP